MGKHDVHEGEMGLRLKRFIYNLHRSEIISLVVAILVATLVTLIIYINVLDIDYSWAVIIAVGAFMAASVITTPRIP